MMRHRDNDTSPIVSVLVPFYNARKNMKALLPSLVGQDFPKDKYEILMVDDGSTDGGSKEITEYSRNNSVAIRIVRQKHKGCYSARNLAARKARGEILAFVDSDEVVQRTWLRKLTKDLLKNNQLSAACGKVVTDKNAIMLSPLRTAPVDAVGMSSGEMQYATCNIAYRKEAFMKLGGFDERFDPLLRGDTDLGLQARKSNLAIVYEPRAQVYHPVKELRLRGIFRLAKYRYHDVLLYKKHGKLAKRSFGSRLFQPLIGRFSPVSLLFIFLVAVFVFLLYTSPSWLLSPSSLEFLPWLKSIPLLPSLPRLLFYPLLALFLWIIFFCLIGYRSMSQSRHKPGFSLRLKSSLILPIYLFAIFIAHIYGSVKYRSLML